MSSEPSIDTSTDASSPSTTRTGRPKRVTRGITNKTTPAIAAPKPPATSSRTKPKPTTPAQIQGPFNPITGQHGNITLHLKTHGALNRSDSITTSSESDATPSLPIRPLPTQRIDNLEHSLAELDTAVASQISSLSSDVRKLAKASINLTNFPDAADIQTLNSKVDVLVDRVDSAIVLLDSAVQETQLYDLLSLVQSLAQQVAGDRHAAAEHAPVMDTSLPRPASTPIATPNRNKRGRSPSSAANTPQPKSQKCPPTDICVANVPWSSPPDDAVDAALLRRLVSYMIIDNADLERTIPRTARAIWPRNDDRIRCIRFSTLAAADAFLAHFKDMAAHYYPNNEAVAYPASKHDFYVALGHPTPDALASPSTPTPHPQLQSPNRPSPSSSQPSQLTAPSPTPTYSTNADDSLSSILTDLATMRRTLAAKQKAATGDD